MTEPGQPHQGDAEPTQRIPPLTPPSAPPSVPPSATTASPAKKVPPVKQPPPAKQASPPPAPVAHVPPPPRPPTALSSNSLPVPPDGDADDVVWQELAWRFSYYNGAASRHRIWYQALKVVTLLLGAAVTVLAATKSPAAVTAALAATGVAVEGISQLFQLHSQWISFRRVAELLRQHAFDYAARVSPYDGDDRRGVLAKAMRTITADENASWAKAMDKPGSN